MKVEMITLLPHTSVTRNKELIRVPRIVLYT